MARIVGWFVAVWVPAAVIAFVVSMRASMTALLIAEFGPVGGLASFITDRPWWQAGVVAAIILFAVVAATLALARERIRLGAGIAASVCGLLLVGMYFVLVMLPVASMVSTGGVE